MDDGLLAIYLNDHLAGATGGLELARRALAENRGTEFEAALARLAEEIAEDRRALIKVMSALGIGRDPLKVLGGWLAEKGARLKLNGRLTGYSPLSRVVELELLALGIEGKRAVWRALEQTRGQDPRLAGADLAGLLRRADRQRRLVEQSRRRAAELAFGAG